MTPSEPKFHWKKQSQKNSAKHPSAKQEWAFKDLAEEESQSGGQHLHKDQQVVNTSMYVISHSYAVQLSDSESDEAVSKYDELIHEKEEKERKIDLLESELGEVTKSLKSLISQFSELKGTSSTSRAIMADQQVAHHRKKIKEDIQVQETAIQKSRRQTASTSSDRSRQFTEIEPTSKSYKAKSQKQHLEEKKNKVYSFKRDAVAKIFQAMVRDGLVLPKSVQPSEIRLVHDPRYCLYHRGFGHIIEDCWSFRDLVEKKYKSGDITIPKKYLLPNLSVEQEKQDIINTTSHRPVKPISRKKSVTKMAQTKPNRQKTLIECMKEKESIKFSFRNDAIKSIFRKMIKSGMTLPTPKRPEEVGLIHHPLYCSYHQLLGHTTENCWVFKELVEGGYQTGNIRLPEKYLCENTKMKAQSMSEYEAYDISSDTSDDEDLSAKPDTTTTTVISGQRTSIQVAETGTSSGKAAVQHYWAPPLIWEGFLSCVPPQKNARD